MENVLFGLAFLLQQHFLKLQRYRHEAVGRLGLERTLPGSGVREVYVTLDMYLVLFPVEIAPFQPQRLSAPQAQVVQYPEE